MNNQNHNINSQQDDSDSSSVNSTNTEPMQIPNPPLNYQAFPLFPPHIVEMIDRLQARISTNLETSEELFLTNSSLDDLNSLSSGNSNFEEESEGLNLCTFNICPLCNKNALISNSRFDLDSLSSSSDENVISLPRKRKKPETQDEPAEKRSRSRSI